MYIYDRREMVDKFIFALIEGRYLVHGQSILTLRMEETRRRFCALYAKRVCHFVIYPLCFN